MASYIFTIKRNNGSGIDEYFPKTSLEQVLGLSDALSVKVNTNLLGAPSGVATLDSTGKINAGQLPDYVFGGMKFKSSISLSTFKTVDDAISDGIVNIGDYLIVSIGGEFRQGTLWTGTIEQPGDEGDYVFPVDLENGDWIVCTAMDSTAKTVSFAIVNNTHANATQTSFGITRLSQISSTGGASGNNVITDGILAGLMGTGAGKIAHGDHNHNSVYQPLDADLSAIAGLATTDGNIIVGNGSTWVAESGATARASLGLTIGTHVQAYNSKLASLAGLSLTDNQMVYSSGGLFVTAPLTAFARTILDDADAASVRSTIGAQVAGSYQTLSAQLTTLAGLSSADGNFIVGSPSGFVVESGATARASLDVHSTGEINALLSNRPKIFFNTTVGTGIGDLIIADVVLI